MRSCCSPIRPSCGGGDEFSGSTTHGRTSDLELRFDFDPELERNIRAELERDQKSAPTFEYGFYRTDDLCCTRIRNTVAIRPKGYRKATPPPAANSGLG